MRESACDPRANESVCTDVIRRGHVTKVVAHRVLRKSILFEWNQF